VAAGAQAANRPGGWARQAQAEDTTAVDTAAVRTVPFRSRAGRWTQAFHRFLRQLEASPLVTDVVPISAQTVIEKERPVTAFSIRPRSAGPTPRTSGPHLSVSR
jgi:hypothetical protein